MCNSNLTKQDEEIIKALQEDFPLCEEPYKVLAARAGVTEEEFLQRDREVGFKFNALCAWEVPTEKLDDVAKIMSSHPAVSHCYDRNTAPNWNYNLYTMIHAKTREECDAIILELSQIAGVENYQVLYSKKEWKKTAMQYFKD